LPWGKLEKIENLCAKTILNVETMHLKSLIILDENIKYNMATFFSKYDSNIMCDVISIPRLSVDEIWTYLIQWLEDIHADIKEIRKYNMVLAEHGTRGGKNINDAKKTIKASVRPNEDNTISVAIELIFAKVSSFGMSLLADEFDFDSQGNAGALRWKQFVDPFLKKVSGVVQEIDNQELAQGPSFCLWCGVRIGYPWPKFCPECGQKMEGFNVKIKE
jgi:hypothetical protein